MIFNFSPKKKERPTKIELEFNKEDFKPIRACIIDSNLPIDDLTKNIINRIKKEGQFVDYYGKKSYFKKFNFKNAGEQTYVISESNEEDKYSELYCNCTGIVMVGEEKYGKKQISFLSHQDPFDFITLRKNNFKNDLVEVIKDFKNKIKEKSKDILIFGGNSFEYKHSIEYITKVLKEEFDFNPIIITGPNLNHKKGPTHIYFDTQNRRLYILRPGAKQRENEHYEIEDFYEQSKKWYEGKGKK